MKVLLINGSPREKGCTHTALNEVAGALEKGGVETKMIWLGAGPIQGCIACGACKTSGKCRFEDQVNETLAAVDEFDGFVFGTPVYYASASGQIRSFLDRLFYASQGRFSHKVGAAVASCRRAGTTTAFDQLNKYFTISNMPIASSNYWNGVHGNTPDEVRQDLEGMQTMRTLGTNMAWLLASIEAGRKAGIAVPLLEEKTPTNFIR